MNASLHPAIKNQSPEFLQGSGTGKAHWQILAYLQVFSVSKEQNPWDDPLCQSLAHHTPTSYTWLVLRSGKGVLGHGHA